MSGRSRSLATTVFFEAQLLGVDEVPDRPIIDLEAALGEFGDKSAQGEVACLGALQQPGTVLARNGFRLVATHLPPPNAAGLTQARHPDNRRADPYTELRRRLVAGQAASLNRSNHPLAKVH